MIQIKLVTFTRDRNLGSLEQMLFWLPTENCMNVTRLLFGVLFSLQLKSSAFVSKAILS